MKIYVAKFPQNCSVHPCLGSVGFVGSLVSVFFCLWIFFCLVLGFVFLFKKVFLVGVSNELRCCSCMELTVERRGGKDDAVQFVSTAFFCIAAEWKFML